jgi:site-specific DNA recombinase
VLRETANKILVEGYSLNAATRFFREKTGRPAVKPITLRGALTGPNIAGMREYLPVADKRRGITKGTVRKANWEGVLDMQTWQALQDALRTTPRGRPSTPSLLSGILVCGACDTTLGYSKHSYRCTTTTGGCGKEGISTKGIEAHILKLFNIDDRHPNAPLLLALLGASDPQPVPVTDISGELTELADERAQLLYFLKKKTVKAHEIDSRLDEIAAREEELETLQGSQLVANAQSAAAASLRSEWGKLTDSPEDTAKRNLVIRGMFKRVVVRPATKQGPTLDPSRLLFEGHDAIEPMNPDEIVWW